MSRFIIAIIVILITFAACSRNGNSIIPDTPVDDPGSMLSAGTGTDSDPNIFAEDGIDVWGAYEIAWDVESGTAGLSERSAELALRHFKVSYFLNSPWCSDCIDIDVLENNFELGTGTFNVTLKNPTALNGYDVRGMLRISHTDSLRMLNPDGYSNLFEDPSYISPAPFKTYVENMPDHRFNSWDSNTATFELKTQPGTTLSTFTFLVTAGHPSPAGDVSYIGEFRQSGQLKSGGGTAHVSFNIQDLQDDIGGVLLHAGPVGGGDIWMMPVGGRFEASLINSVTAPGMYELKVDAYSPNFQNAVTSHYFRAMVFHELDSFRAELLSLVNQDRANNGLPPLTIDPLLNTAAQAHAQDMADKEFFSHTNLDNWSPWQRMDYYGIEYSSAGENIATGHDTPSQVETAWMDSPGHMANILGDSFGKIGLGIVPSNPSDRYYPGYYWVQTFSN